MIRWLVAGCLLFLTGVVCLAQIPTTGAGKGAPSGGGSYDPATVAWVSAVTTAGGTVSGTREGVINTFITCLKGTSTTVLTGTLWSNFDFLYVHAGENSIQGLISLPNPATFHATNNSATFTANVGFTGDGSTTYVDLGYNPATAGVNFTQNSASLGFFDHAFSYSDWKIGASDGTGNVVFNAQLHGSGGIGYGVNDGTVNYDDGGGLTSLGYPPAKGLMGASRTASGATGVLLFVNANSVVPTISATSSGRPSQNMFLGVRNYFGGANGGTTDPLSLSFAGAGYSATDLVNINSCVSALAASIGF